MTRPSSSGPTRTIGERSRLWAAILATVLAIPAAAQQPASGGRVNSSAEPAEDTPDSQANADIALGYQLADYARRNRDASMMIQAARILRELPEARPTSEGEVSALDGSVVPDPVAAESLPDTSDSLLSEASRLARGDRALLRLIREVEASATRGVIGGRIHVFRNVPPATRWSVDLTGRGREVLHVVARGDGRTNIDMFIYDEYGNEVCRHTGRDASPSCRVIPEWSGPFRVQLVNHGRSWTRIGLLTN